MKDTKFNRALDYFPILAYFGFWLQGAALASIMTGEIRLMALGVVTLPAMAAMAAAVLKIRARHFQTDE